MTTLDGDPRSPTGVLPPRTRCFPSELSDPVRSSGFWLLLTFDLQEVRPGLDGGLLEDQPSPLVAGVGGVNQ